MRSIISTVRQHPTTDGSRPEKGVSCELLVTNTAADQLGGTGWAPIASTTCYLSSRRGVNMPRFTVFFLACTLCSESSRWFPMAGASRHVRVGWIQDFKSGLCIIYPHFINICSTSFLLSQHPFEVSHNISTSWVRELKVSEKLSNLLLPRSLI